MKTQVKVEGLRELGQALRELGDDVAKRAIFAATLRAAAVVRNRARELAPRSAKPHRVGRGGPVVQPGNLAAGIATKRLKQFRQGRADYEVRWKAKRKGDPFYGLFQEFGTAHHAAQPFMRPAFDQTKEDALQAMQDTLKKRIAAAAKRAAKGRK